eukprot:TRINITY_DN36509_c0_g1_i2.p1 TRINITY_DN36509_c0_g1~~TRINITY_DN36509_c0_g1_i2.p1  ORF type:complete len:247 (-),score=1.97 TRINITY_DN36509_c0_g1_i2:45-785(-)
MDASDWLELQTPDIPVLHLHKNKLLIRDSNTATTLRNQHRILGVPWDSTNATHRFPRTLSISETISCLEFELLEVIGADGKVDCKAVRSQLFPISPLSMKDINNLHSVVFCDLWRRGYYLSNGDNYGADFAVYNDDPSRCHAEFIVSLRDGNEHISALQLIAWCRLANTVKKKLLIAFYDSETTNISACLHPPLQQYNTEHSGLTQLCNHIVYLQMEWRRGLKEGLHQEGPTEQAQTSPPQLRTHP